MIDRAEEFRSRGLPAPVFFVLFAGASAVGLGLGYVGAAYLVDLVPQVSHSLARRLLGIGGLGLVLGAVFGGVQTLAVFRASGRGKLWAAGTAVGSATGMSAFALVFDLASFSNPALGIAPMALMGACVGFGQWLSVRRAWWLLHVVGCTVALIPWFPIQALFAGGDQFLMLVIAPLVAGAAAAAIASTVLWLAIRADAASSRSASVG